MNEIDDAVDSILSLEDDLKKVPISKRSVIIAPKPSKEYLRLATKLGTHFQEVITREKLESCLKEHAAGIYPLPKVMAWMDAKIKAANAEPRKSRGWGDRVKIKWGWFPLRDADMSYARRNFRRAMPTLYLKEVPVEVLAMVEKIADQLGGGAKFFVADAYKESAPRPKVPDPFLAVTAKSLPLYVIERWNEPGFRM